MLSWGSWKQDRSRIQLRGPCGLRRGCLGLHQRTRPAVGVSMATSEDRGDWTLRYVFNPNAEVVVHYIGILYSDIILVDKTHSGCCPPPHFDVDNNVGSDREYSMRPL
jgi:hypothetical protein